VRHHLDLSVTAQKKDISDVAVINDFARKVGDQTHLDYLYVLTVADVRGTNPKLWNTWKASLFDEFYERIKRALRQGLESPLGEAELILETQAEVLGLLQRDGFSSKAIEPVWAPLSNAYFLRHTAEEIAWHTTFLVERDPFDEDPIVAVRQETGRGGTAIFVYARRQLTSFARSTAVLDQMGLTVLDARITLTQNGFSVETYLVLEDSGGAIVDRGRMHEIQQNLHQQLVGDDHTPTVTRRAPRQTRLFATPTQVSFSQDSNHTRTVLELVAADRPGLLSDVGKVFVQQQLQLHGARIVTVGERAEDVFYLSDTHDQPLDRTRCDAIAVAVKATLDKAQG
jgi:[protein-PII] uridylyltransferase